MLGRQVQLLQPRPQRHAGTNGLPGGRASLHVSASDVWHATSHAVWARHSNRSITNRDRALLEQLRPPRPPTPTPPPHPPRIATYDIAIKLFFIITIFCYPPLNNFLMSTMLCQDFGDGVRVPINALLGSCSGADALSNLCLTRYSTRIGRSSVGQTPSASAQSLRSCLFSPWAFPSRCCCGYARASPRRAKRSCARAVQMTRSTMRSWRGTRRDLPSSPENTRPTTVCETAARTPE